MSQPSDGATDLGQELPTGLVRRVSCEAPRRPADAEKPAFANCSVSWQTVGGDARATRYLVRLFPTGCFAAGARPPLPQHRDTTIESYGENPLNALVSVEPQCS